MESNKYFSALDKCSDRHGGCEGCRKLRGCQRRTELNTHITFSGVIVELEGVPGIEMHSVSFPGGFGVFRYGLWGAK